uniref:Uncharacterized protein n=1 Tax=Opuntia streptacantha TaxID=393608 RepID=A0A7C8Z9F4_OPUST
MFCRLTNELTSHLKLEDGKLDPRRTIATRKNRALNKGLAISVDTNVDLIKLTVTICIMVTLDPRVEPDGILDGLFDILNVVEFIIAWLDPGVLEGLEEVGLVLEVQGSLEVLFLVQDLFRTSTMLVPLMSPEPPPYAWASE